MGGRNYRTRSITDLADEFEYILKEMPEIKEIFIEDDTFTVNQQRVKDFCDEIIKRNLHSVWSCNTRVDLTYETMKKMKEAGCRLLVCGYESGNQEVLDATKNEMRLDDINFELATTSLLAKSANWMLHGTFKNLIAEKARFSFDKDMSTVLADFKDYRQNLGYGTTLKAQIAQVRPQGVFFTTNDIKAFVVVEGKLALEVNQNK